ncbi:hypothetical protein AGR5A_pb0089 [Agrobacterium genomosp. 5 str. CFBP 6626]|nr:hypothetical protein AGR5A_pb0089 [Agrobacterium genomosp. 5 str. CFBP 6626]
MLSIAAANSRNYRLVADTGTFLELKGPEVRVLGVIC